MIFKDESIKCDRTRGDQVFLIKRLVPKPRANYFSISISFPRRREIVTLLRRVDDSYLLLVAQILEETAQQTFMAMLIFIASECRKNSSPIFKK